MKINHLVAVAFVALFFTACGNKSGSDTAESKTEVVNGEATSTFKVWGNCDMCKETIEGSLKADGITKADWNTETDMITVSYDASKISLDQIHKNISSVGYDTEKYKGDDKAYADLPECCQYERK
ncbi:MAG TPA: heavy-metal-associated domain-containing protein [Bacteroidia bacterium]|jgi:copper chaperone CopZ